MRLGSTITMFLTSFVWYSSLGYLRDDDANHISGALLKSSLERFVEPGNLPLGHLAAELRAKSNDSVVKSIHLEYGDHPHERILLNGVMDYFQGKNTNASSIFSSSQNSSSTLSSSAFPTRAPSSTPTAKRVEPIRIVFDTSQIESRGSDYVEIRNGIERITNKVSEIWKSILSVVPVDGNIYIDEDSCYGFIDFSSNVIQEGVPNADLVIFVSAHDRINNVILCDENALASASYCSLDQYDRPVVGFINFCLDNFDVNNNEDEAVAIGVHELTHVLGFSDDLFKYFRNSDDGTPLTARPFALSTVECVDGSIQELFLASTKTLQQKGEEGSIYYEIVSPTVAEIARNHFDCGDLMGARLENQPTRKSCTGVHWDERYFFTDIMSPIFSSDSVSMLSPLTVALIKDTGWYGEVSFASKYIKNNPFGLGAGCDFLIQDNCISKNKVPEQYEEYFCDTVTQFTNDGYPTRASSTTCDPSFSHIAYCSLIDLSTMKFLHKDYTVGQTNYSYDGISSINGISKQFDNPNLGSIFLQSDNCPMASIFDIDCTDPSTKVYKKLYPEEDYGASSKCFNSIFKHPFRGDIKKGVCLTSRCNKVEGVLEVFIGGEMIVCNYDGETHQFPVSRDVFFVCPPLMSICPQLACPSMCSGNGICNHSKDPPQCECYDEEDMSPGCYGVGVGFEIDDDGYEFTFPNRPINDIIFYGDNAAGKIECSYISVLNVFLWGATLTMILF